MKIFYFLVLVYIFISFVNCYKSNFLKKAISRLSNPKISVNTYYIQPKLNASVYLIAGSPYIYKSPPPLGQSVSISTDPTLLYVNIKKGLIRDYLNGTVLVNQTLAGGNTRPTIILLFKTPSTQEYPELIDPSWEIIKRKSRNKTYYSITKLVTNPISLKEEIWAFTYDQSENADIVNRNLRFELYNKTLETQKWRIY